MLRATERHDDLAAVVATIAAGRNSMPGFDGTLSSEAIRDVGAYVIEVLSGATR